MDYLDFSHGGNIHAIKKKYNKQIIDFSANINPLGLCSKARKAITINFDKIVHYPEPQAPDIRRKIAEYWGVSKGNVLVGNGSVELIYLIVSAFMPKAVAILIPTFSEYERASRRIKSRIRFIKLAKDNFKFPVIKNVREDILFICNPNNPTGNIILSGRGIVEEDFNKLLVVDETFMDFLSQEKEYSFINRAKKSRKIIVLRTFTKFFALPGLRIGYLIAHKDVINFLARNQIPWSVNALAQAAAKAALDDKSYMRETKIYIKKEREFLFGEIKKIKGLVPYPSVTNFLLIKIGDKNLTSPVLVEKLIKKGLLIRDCSNFRGLNSKFIRVAVRSRKENQKLLKALREIL